MYIDDCGVLIDGFSEFLSYDVIILVIMNYGIMNLWDNCKLCFGVFFKFMLVKLMKVIIEVFD